MKLFFPRYITTLLRSAILENASTNPSRFLPCADLRTRFSRRSSSGAPDIGLNSLEKTQARPKTGTLLKKRHHKKKAIEELHGKDGMFLAVAYATAESYDLDGIRDALSHQENIDTDRLATLDANSVVHTSVCYNEDDEPREIFFFQEGVAVFWNCSEFEANNTLEFLKQYQHNPYSSNVIHKEREAMTYSYSQSGTGCKLQESHFALVAKPDNVLEKYTFSNAMALSVKLGVWEQRLERMASAVQAFSDSMKKGHTLRLDKQQVTRQLGSMLLLRHCINVESDLLDTPDFYWEHEEMEKLYAATVAYFSIASRTRVLNSRLSHCVELARLLSGWATDRQFVRLEWLIIALLVMSVVFESPYLVK